MGDSQVLKGANVGYSEELAIFSHPVQEVGVKGIQHVPFYPVNDYGNDSGMLEFMISGSGSRYVDLRKTKLALKCKVTKADGTALPARKDDKGEIVTESLVSPVNSLFSSMFERVDIQLQEKCVTPADTNYAYTAYLKNLLFTSKTAKETSLQSQLYYPDKASGMESYNCSEKSNPGLITRAEFVEGSKTFDMEGPLACDVCDIQKFIPQGVSMRFKFYPAKSAFSLMSPVTGNPDYVVKIVRAVLKVCTVEVTQEVLLSHSEILREKMGIFSYIKHDTKVFQISKGSYFYELSDPFASTVPSTLTVGLVKEKSRNGDLTGNPFNFITAGVTYVQLSVDGKEVACYEPSYDDDKPERSHYTAAFNALHSLDNTEDNGISRLDFAKGYALYNFVIDPSSSAIHDSDLMPLKRQGNLRLIIKFKKPVENPLALIVMGRSPAALKLDRSRVVYTT